MLKRTPLKVKLRNGLKRTPLKAKSNKQMRKDAELERIRPIILKRDNKQCVLCGKPYQELHHITYRSGVGQHEEKNLCCLCWHCHRIVAHGQHSKQIRERLRNILSERYGYEY